jgi:hypothetical protein
MSAAEWVLFGALMVCTFSLRALINRNERA